ncbi:hypothetical protein MTO96_033617 [Rhipicephalus appendiculatus]
MMSTATFPAAFDPDVPAEGPAILCAPWSFHSNPGCLCHRCSSTAVMETLAATIARCLVIPTRMRRGFGRTPARVSRRSIQATICNATKLTGNLSHGAGHTVTRALCTRRLWASKFPTPPPVRHCKGPARSHLR